MNSIWFDPRAEEEFLLGVKYYEGQELGLGHCFFLAVQAALKTVSENPQIYRCIVSFGHAFSSNRSLNRSTKFMRS